jgi:3-oxoadipate enol-lactonase / 4-carboxymuconolactone decarboxylase
MNHHVLEGPEHAPVLLFAGSLGATHAMWDAQAEAFKDSYRVLRYDHRGHGDSPVPPGPYTVDELAGDVLELLDELAIGRVTFVGLSLGGAVGMALALRAPERVERLALCCTSRKFGPSETWAERAATVRAEGVEAVADAALERWLTPEAPEAMREKLRAMLVSIPAEGYASCAEAIGGHDLRGQLTGIRIPTLVVAGAADPASPPEELSAIAGEIAGARLHVLEARHLAVVERADEFNHLLRDFLSDGVRTRREVLGDEHVDAAIERTTDFTADFQALITRYAWGEIWTRPGLDRRTRSVITLTALVAGGHENELAIHTRAALRNGLTPDEIKEVLLQTAIYCGVPAANSAFAIAQRVIGEEAK